MRTVLTFIAGLTIWTSTVVAQHSALSSSDCAGSWYLDRVAFSEPGMEFLRKSIGMENGVFSEAKYEKNWKWIQQKIENRAYKLGISPKLESCEYESQDSIQRGAAIISFHTAANGCSGCGVVKNGILKMESPLCTQRGCDIEEAIFYDLVGPIPIHLLDGMLVIGSWDGRCMYFLKRDEKK